MLRRPLAVLAALLIAAPAWAQPVTAIGPVTPNNFAAFNSPTVIKDSGTAASVLPINTPPVAYPCTPALVGGCISPQFTQPPLIVGGFTLCVLQQNCVYTGNNVYPFGVAASNPLGAGVNATVTPVATGTLGLTFTSAAPGFPVTITAAATGSAQQNAIAICNALIANTTLHAANALPVICDPITGQSGANWTFNLQWDARTPPNGVSDLKVQDAGTGAAAGAISCTGGNVTPGCNFSTTGGGPSVPASVNQLDFVTINFGRIIPNYVGHTFDSPVCLEIFGQNNTGASAGNALLCSTTENAVAANYSANLTFNTAIAQTGHTQLGFGSGIAVYGRSAGIDTLPGGSVADGGTTWAGYTGQGTINLPGSLGGGIYSDGVATLTKPSAAVNIGNSGTGAFNFISAAAQTVFQVAPIAATGVVNFLEAVGTATGTAPQIAAQGTDTNVGISLLPKGSGVVNVTANGLQAGGAAATGHYLRGNGTAYVDATIAPADLALGQLTAARAADLSLGAAGTLTDVVAIAQGTTGTWWVIATATVVDTAGAAVFVCQLWDGTTVIASTATESFAAGINTPMTLGGYLAAPAGNLRMSCKDNSAATGSAKASIGQGNNATTIFAFRIN